MNRIKDEKLAQMLNSGKSPKECAQHFGVSQVAIWKARKKLKVNVIKNVALENAHRVVSSNLDAVSQLQKINEHANELLDSCMRWMRGDEEAIQILESQVKQVRVGQGKDVEWVKEFKFKDPREIALRAMAEIRGQLGLQLQIFQTLYDMEAVQKFQEEVLTAIGEADEETRDKIVLRLKERRALRPSIQMTR
jgi:hypothetical protein